LSCRPDGESESADLLARLFDHSVRPEHVYRHCLWPHHLAFWDNRSTMRLATGCHDDLRRRLNRTTIGGDRPFCAVSPA
jgi:taurine dioxygenase